MYTVLHDTAPEAVHYGVNCTVGPFDLPTQHATSISYYKQARRPYLSALYWLLQELMSGEAAKEHVTAVLSKLLAYFHFSVHPLTSCDLSLTLLSGFPIAEATVLLESVD